MYVVNLFSLSEFLAEAALTHIVRVDTHGIRTRKQHVAWLELCLDMTTVKSADTVLWLRYSKQLAINPYDNEVQTEHGQAIHAAWEKLLEMIRDHVRGQGFMVSPGVIGIPDNITPVVGDLGVRFDTEAGRFVWREAEDGSV